MRFKKTILMTLFFIALIIVSKAGETVVFDGNKKIQRIVSQAILEDKTGSLTYDEVIRSDQFHQSELDIPNLAVSSSTFWIKFEIKNLSSKNKLALLLEVPTIDHVELYIFSEKEKISEHSISESNPFYEREYNDPNYIFDVEIPKGEKRIFLLKVRSIEQMMVPLSIGERDQIWQIIANNNLIFGLYSGLILIMFFYNLFVYFTVKDNSYLYYIAYLLFIGLTQVSLKGYTFKYLWPGSPWLAQHSIVILSSIAAIAGLLFLRSFLQTKNFTPKLDRVLDVMNVVFVISIVLSLLGFGQISFTVMQLDTLIFSIFALFIAYKISRKGYRPAKFFLLAWSVLFVGVIIFVLKDFGIIPYNRLTTYTLQIASSVEAILLSFALADRINIFKMEKEEAQARELVERKEKQEILERQTETLKIKVDEATQELKEKNEELNETNQILESTLDKLKRTQAELVQKQKMASLGQLAAGVAHEVNNPLNVINSSLDIIKRDYDDLILCINRFQSIEVSVQDLAEKVKEAQSFTEKDMEYDIIVEEIQQALDRARHGVARSTQITSELKAFSKVDTEGFTRTDINKDIDAMLDMLQSSLGNIQVKKQYEDLHLIECNATKLNQLYFNILMNSVEAIRKKEIKESEGLIKIETHFFEGNVVISFSDNGVGMSEEVMSKAFDPFFTTKGVEGKGFGLANVYSTMSEHDGKVEIKSKEGEGTTISLIIPVKHQHIKPDTNNG